MTTTGIPHPGFEWVGRASCASADVSEGGGTFFVDAGRVIDAATRETCLNCPVRQQCIAHAYIGGPGRTMIGAGYFGGFSLGQRKAMTLEQALARAAAERPTGRQGRLL